MQPSGLRWRAKPAGGAKPNVILIIHALYVKSLGRYV